MGGVALGLRPLLEMETVSAGVPSIRSSWFALLRVRRRAEPGGIETCISASVNSRGEGELELLGRLIRIVFFPEEFDP